mgnify:CR=1 FL=1
MSSGIEIDEKEFLKLPQKERDKIIFRNTEELKVMVQGYKSELKMHRVAFGITFILIGAGKFIGLI